MLEFFLFGVSVKIMKAAVVEAVVDRVEDGDKEKKKRRPRRRPKQNSAASGKSQSPLLCSLAF